MLHDPRRVAHRGLDGEAGFAARRILLRRRSGLLRLGEAAPPPHGAAGEAAVALGGDPPLVEGEAGHEPGRLEKGVGWVLGV